MNGQRRYGGPPPGVYLPGTKPQAGSLGWHKQLTVLALSSEYEFQENVIVQDGTPLKSVFPVPFASDIYFNEMSLLSIRAHC